MRPPILPLLAILLLALPLATPAAVRGPKPEKLPRGDTPSRSNVDLTPPSRRQRIFGVGVGFDTTGTLSGVALRTVLPDSPAVRAGLAVGCIVTEINGEATAGRTGEDCARIIRDGGPRVRLKFLDPAMRERTITLEKQWIVVPE